MSKFLGSDKVKGYPELSYDNSNFDSFQDLIEKAYKEGSLKIHCHRLTALWLEFAGNLRFEDDNGPDYVECNLSIADAELIQKMGEEVFGRWMKKND